jgi:hypothetical protein
VRRIRTALTIRCPLKAEAPTEYKKAIETDDEFRKVPLDPRVPDRAVCISTETCQEELWSC